VYYHTPWHWPTVRSSRWRASQVTAHSVVFSQPERIRHGVFSEQRHKSGSFGRWSSPLLSHHRYRLCVR
jgi:hypothetical protein